MNESISSESTSPTEGQEEEANSRRLFLQGMGKWSGAAIVAAVAGVSVTTTPNAQGAWINRRGGGGRSWVNRGGGGWINRRRGGGWINRR